MARLVLPELIDVALFSQSTVMAVPSVVTTNPWIWETRWVIKIAEKTKATFIILSNVRVLI